MSSLNFQRDVNHIPMEDDPRVKGMNDLLKKLKKEEIAKQAMKKKA